MHEKSIVIARPERPTQLVLLFHEGRLLGSKPRLDG